MKSWKPIPGYGDRYEASDSGEIRSLARTQENPLTGGVSVHPGRVRIPRLNRGGYLRVNLAYDGTTTTALVHRLVCEAFHGPPPEGKPWALHKDDDKSNNTPENLYWGSPSENMEDTIRNGHHHELNKTHCPKGHPYAGSNLAVNGRSRRCRTCTNARGRDLWRRNRSPNLAPGPEKDRVGQEDEGG